jgi:hypothetical protein
MFNEAKPKMFTILTEFDKLAEIIEKVADKFLKASEVEHIDLIQEKINLYLGFIEGDEVYERCLEEKGYNFVIKTYRKHGSGAKLFNRDIESTQSV